MASPVPLSGDIASANIESVNTGPVIEARQRVVPKPSGPVPGAPNKGSVATAITGIAEKVVNLIQATIDKDLEGRRKFTVDVARGTASLFPGRGIVVCNVGFSTTGNIVHRQIVRYNQKIGATVT
ncbi:hypothetical protein B0T11DRAFT_299390 [Plectosphaerella cucumerina]|uniref:Uncharacterized protein n=1 Tax=Plectosphaerella cucumerina TaxID=40658 RepID=A0A8K0X310_9PEZI|nr:hypothetical protein B0T11DRAFT_299390 [Plectosphaerella cucumerina]